MQHIHMIHYAMCIVLYQMYLYRKAIEHSWIKKIRILVCLVIQNNVFWIGFSLSTPMFKVATSSNLDEHIFCIPLVLNYKLILFCWKMHAWNLKRNSVLYYFLIVNLKIHAKPLFFLTLIKDQSIQHSFTNLRAYDNLVQSLICMVILNTYKVISYNFRLKGHKGKYLLN